MRAIADRLIKSAACSRRFLEKDSRNEVARYIMSQQNPYGGFRGRGEKSDLYYTLFAVAGLRALGAPLPLWRLWKYIRSFGIGDDLDLVHLACLVRLRSAFLLSGKTRRQFFQQLEKHSSESSYDLFLKLFAEDYLAKAKFPEEKLRIPGTDPTPNIAAAVVVNHQTDLETEKTLLDRCCPSGGFAATHLVSSPDLLSTATALFALQGISANLDPIRQPCLNWIESLWRDSGGFAGHVADEFEDVEYTFYALLSIGCLMKGID